MPETTSDFTGWAILELMGHKRLAGYVTEVEFAGAAMIRIDVPGDSEGDVATQLYSPSAVYCLTPTDETTARRVATLAALAPVTRWELDAPSRRAAIEADTTDDWDSGDPGEYLEDDD